MEYITTTQLRTRSPQLVKSLKNGNSVSLIHRSKVIGKIEAVQPTAPPITDIEEFRKFIHSISPKKIIPRSKREQIYRKRLMEKYGKNIS